MVRAALPCFVFLHSLAYHSCQNGKKASSCALQERKLMGHILKPVNHICFGREKYCHMQQVYTNEREIFQLCSLILESEPVKYARFHCQKQTLIKAAQP